MQNSKAMLNYVRLGEGEPLVILHGLFGSGKNWQSLSKIFSEHFDVLTLDLRNHGLSFHDDVMDYPAMVDDVHRLLTHLDITSCRIIGHSMGGKVGMLLALKHPELVSQLVVADIAPVSYKHDYDHLIDPVMALNLNEIGSRSSVDKALQPDIPDLQLRHFLLQSLVRDSDHWRWKNNWLAIKRHISKIAGFPEPEELSAMGGSCTDNWLVNTQTLFISGGNSDYVDEKGKLTIQQHFATPHFKVLKGANHWLHAEQPEQFSEAVLNFFQI